MFYQEFDSYSVFNLFTGVRDEAGKWDVNVWAKNLFDEDVVLIQDGSDATDISAAVAAGGSPGDGIGSYTRVVTLAERTIGITGRYNF